MTWRAAGTPKDLGFRHPLPLLDHRDLPIDGRAAPYLDQARMPGIGDRLGARFARQRSADRQPAQRRREAVAQSARSPAPRLDQPVREGENCGGGACNLEAGGAARRHAGRRLLGSAELHPATNDALLREIFADVHMLSHLRRRKSRGHPTSSSAGRPERAARSQSRTPAATAAGRGRVTRCHDPRAALRARRADHA